MALGVMTGELLSEEEIMETDALTKWQMVERNIPWYRFSWFTKSDT